VEIPPKPEFIDRERGPDAYDEHECQAPGGNDCRTYRVDCVCDFHRLSPKRPYRAEKTEKPNDQKTDVTHKRPFRSGRVRANFRVDAYLRRNPQPIRPLV